MNRWMKACVAIGLSLVMSDQAFAADKEFDYDGQKKAGDDVTKIVFIADAGTHGDKGNHEFMAGALFISRAIHAHYPKAHAVVHSTKNWPKDLSHADTVVVLLNHSRKAATNPAVIAAVDKPGAGFAAIHYGVEVNKGEQGDRFLRWMGGYFETHWSVNPHWTAEVKELPDHPVARGVKPFTVNDEWYFHMRFRPQMQDVTPILTAVPPDSTMKRKDGPHSGNPAVRKAVAAKVPQVLAWVAEREDGGRGFGFTGLHKHWNLETDGFRQTLINGVAWAAKLEIPKDGVPSPKPTREDLEEVIADARAAIKEGR